MTDRNFHSDLIAFVRPQGKDASQNVWMPQTPEPEQDLLDGTPGSINVSSILTGKLVAKVSAVAKPRTFRERKVSDALTGACTHPRHCLLMQQMLMSSV